MNQTNPISVISYIREKGALVQISPAAIPIPFDESASFKGDIHIVHDGIATKYDLIFEFKRKSTSATGIATPATALGLVLAMTSGPQTFKEYSISNVSEVLSGSGFDSV